MPQISNKDSCLLAELALLTEELGCFDTNYGLVNPNGTHLSPFILENPSKTNELKAIKKSIPCLNLDLCFVILQHSHQYFTTSDFMHLLISYFNNNPSLIPENMSEYHESIEFKQQFNDLDLEMEAKLYNIDYSVYRNHLEFTDKQILKLINKEMKEKRETQLKQQFDSGEMDREVEFNKLSKVPYSVIKDELNWTDLNVFNFIKPHLLSDAHVENHKEESKNIDGLFDYIETMDKSEDELIFPLYFRCFSSNQVMHRMITDHESIMISNPFSDQESRKEYDEFVRNVNMLKTIVEFIQNNTSNSRIYSIPTFVGDGQYWCNFSNKYYGTVFVFGETCDGNLLGFHFEQDISI